MSTDSLVISIHNAVTNDLQESSQLLDLLEQEQHAVAQRDQQRLSTILEAKTDSLNRIDHNASVRYQILKSLDRSGNESEWKSLVEEQENSELLSDWHALIDNLHQCRHSNEVNGRLINRGQRTLHHLLTILRGQFDSPDLYTQRGTTESTSGGNSFTKA